MEILIQLVGKEKTELTIKRNWFTGVFVYIVNGQQHLIKSALDLSAHFNLSLKKIYEFEIGVNDVHKIKIEHTRPVFLAGIRPQQYDIFIDGELYKTYNGY
jgi:hypothetical protein